MKRIYIDYAATTPAHADVVKAMLPYFTETFGNPSSIHACGLEAKEAVESSRIEVAGFIGARSEELFFTSGGTEADNFAIKGVAYANQKKGNHIITCAIEHHAVLETCKFLEENGFEVTYLPVDGEGRVDPDAVKQAITPKTILISIMHANNEIGTVEPIAEIGKIARAAGVYFHTDAVQTTGHLRIDVNELGVDLLAMSAHKLYGPKGVGALYIRRGTKITPFMHGGGQESGMRSSTQNVPGIVGLAEAVRIARREMVEEIQRLTFLRDKLIKGILQRIEDTRLNGPLAFRLPNNVNISVSYVEGESMCLNLDLAGICASTGSACSSGSLEPSHVLRALGLSADLAYGSLRFSLGKWTTEEEIDRILDVLPKIVGKLRAMSPIYRSRQGR
ncbi:MAG: cysteine desulfurase NifS [Dehalococcoidales bacterium]|nr:cysteine desulfurase NifS [Dehalococcoidales bacterium]